MIVSLDYLGSESHERGTRRNGNCSETSSKRSEWSSVVVAKTGPAAAAGRVIFN